LTEVAVVNQTKCLGCGQCMLVCDFDAAELIYGISHIKQDACTACGVCLDSCPVAAIDWEEK